MQEALEIPVTGGGGRPYFYDFYGELLTLEQIAKKTGIHKKLIQKRICRGWDIYGASEIPISIGKQRGKGELKCQDF